MHKLVYCDKPESPSQKLMFTTICNETKTTIKMSWCQWCDT